MSLLSLPVRVGWCRRLNILVRNREGGTSRQVGPTLGWRPSRVKCLCDSFVTHEVFSVWKNKSQIHRPAGEGGGGRGPLGGLSLPLYSASRRGRLSALEGAPRSILGEFSVGAWMWVWFCENLLGLKKLWDTSLLCGSRIIPCRRRWRSNKQSADSSPRCLRCLGSGETRLCVGFTSPASVTATK